MKNIDGQQSEEKSSPKQCDEKAPGASGNVTILLVLLRFICEGGKSEREREGVMKEN